jgi:hypothetical protein
MWWLSTMTMMVMLTVRCALVPIVTGARGATVSAQAATRTVARHVHPAMLLITLDVSSLVPDEHVFVDVGLLIGHADDCSVPKGIKVFMRRRYDCLQLFGVETVTAGVLVGTAWLLANDLHSATANSSGSSSSGDDGSSSIGVFEAAPAEETIVAHALGA